MKDHVNPVAGILLLVRVDPGWSLQKYKEGFQTLVILWSTLLYFYAKLGYRSASASKDESSQSVFS